MRLKKLGKFFTKKVPKFVTRDLPKATVTGAKKLGHGAKSLGNKIASISKRETYRPQLESLRQQVEAVDHDIGVQRDRFFAQRANYQAAFRRYQALSEDYASQFADTDDLTLKVKPVDSGDWDDPASKSAELFQHAEGGLRFVLGFASFNTSESLWAAKEAKEEEAFLKQRLSELRMAQGRFKEATAGLQSAMREIERAIERLKAKFNETDASKLDERLNQQHLQQSQDDARLDIARKLLREGASIEQAALITGLEPSLIRDDQNATKDVSA